MPGVLGHKLRRRRCSFSNCAAPIMPQLRLTQTTQASCSGVANIHTSKVNPTLKPSQSSNLPAPPSITQHTHPAPPATCSLAQTTPKPTQTACVSRYVVPTQHTATRRLQRKMATGINPVHTGSQRQQQPASALAQHNHTAAIMAKCPPASTPLGQVTTSSSSSSSPSLFSACAPPAG